MERAPGVMEETARKPKTRFFSCKYIVPEGTSIFIRTSSEYSKACEQLQSFCLSFVWSSPSSIRLSLGSFLAVVMLPPWSPRTKASKASMGHALQSSRSHRRHRRVMHSPLESIEGIEGSCTTLLLIYSPHIDRSSSLPFVSSLLLLLASLSFVCSLLDAAE